VIFLISSISVKDLDMIKNNIIDIRSIEKYNSSHIPNAKSIPKLELVTNYSKYLNKRETYYIYCQYGKTSLQVCAYLTKLGYNVKNLIGGYENWLLEK